MTTDKNTPDKPSWGAELEPQLALLTKLVPDNLDRKRLLARYSDGLGLTKADIKSRHPGFDYALRECDNFEDVLAYFGRDLAHDKFGLATTLEQFDEIIGEIVTALVEMASTDIAGQTAVN